MAARERIAKTGEKIMKKGEDLVGRMTGSNMVMDNLEALYIMELNDMYDAETQIIEAMPMMIDTANNGVLKKELQRHLEQTKRQREKLGRVIQDKGEKINPQTCKGMKGILKEGEDLMKKDASPNVKDAALIASAQKVEHYEIASYGTVVEFARLLNERDAEKVLGDILKEEKQANELLTNLAVRELNVKAVEGL